MKKIVVLLLSVLCISGVSFAAADDTKEEIVALYNAAKLSGPGSVNNLVGPAPLWKYEGAQQRGYKKGKGGLQKEKDAWELAAAKWGERYLGVVLLATKDNNVALVKELLRHKANIDKKCKNQLEMWRRFSQHVLVAVKTDNKAMVDAFLDAHVTMRYLFYPGKIGPLAWAALHGSVNALQAILNFKTAWASPGGTFSEFTSEYAKELHEKSEDGLTPLDCAYIGWRSGKVASAKYGIIKAVLLDYGATGKSKKDLDAWYAESY